MKVFTFASLVLMLSLLYSCHRDASNTPETAMKEAKPYLSWKSYYSHKKQKRKAGYHKLDAPEEYAKLERARRTPSDMDAPGYTSNYMVREFRKAKSRIAIANRNAQDELTFVERGPGNIAGRTRALLILASDPSQQSWLAASASGGIWKTNDRGQTWTEKTADFPNLGTNTLAYSPSDPNIIYAGTGEHFVRDVDGTGMFKSQDEGETWTQIVNSENFKDFRNVSRIAVSPEDANIVIATTRNSVYADSLLAAIYKSTDGGNSWEAKLTSESDRYDDIAVNPQNFNTQYVAIDERGVIKSLDQGETWFDASNGLNVVGRIEICTSPLDTNYVWALAEGFESGTNTDLYLSKDGGENWDLVIDNSGNAIDYLGGQGWYDNVICAHPFNKNMVYVGGVNMFKIEASENPEEVLEYTIRDEGAFSFLDFINGASIGGGIQVSPVENVSEAISIELRFGQGNQRAHRFTVNRRGAGVPDLDYVYQDYVLIPFQVWDITNDRQLMVSFRDQQEDGFWTLKSRTLNSANPSGDSREYIFVHNIPYSEDADPNISIDGGQTYEQSAFMWPILRSGATFSTTSEGDFSIQANTLLRSTGETTVISDAYFDFNGINSFSSQEEIDNIGHHPDQHSIQFIIEDSANEVFRLLTTNDGGVYYTKEGMNPGAQEGDFIYGGLGYNTSQFYGADKMPGADRYIGGMQDNSTYFSPEGESANPASFYKFAIGGDGFESIWNNRDPNLMIGGSQFNGLARSTDRGRTWQNATTGLDNDGPFVTRIANSRENPDRLYAVGASGVYVSTNFGESWNASPISSNFWRFSNRIDIEVSPANPNVVWTGAFLDEDNRLFVSTNGGDSFQTTNYFRDEVMGAVSGIACHPEDDKIAYALFSFAGRPKVLRTKDSGTSWEDITAFSSGSSTNGFPDVAVNCLLVFPNDTNRIWVGTEIGIVESLDNGNTWNLLEGNIPAVNVWQMLIQDDQIVIATYGRGIWSVTIDGLGNKNIFPPLVYQAVVSPVNTIEVSSYMVNEYDSVHVWIDGGEVDQLGINLPIGDLAFNLENLNLSQGFHEIQLIGFLDSAEYPSLPSELFVFDIKEPVSSYFNDFSDPNQADDFFGAGFTVRLEEGFESPAIHSDHNYLDNSNIFYQLTQPILVSEGLPFTYRDVAIIETGEPGAEFSSNDFYDFVVVEGSKDGINWVPIANGYDASLVDEWEEAYDAGTEGSAELFRAQEIDLSDTFEPDDIIFIRFRLFADAFVSGWGWAIDDVQVGIATSTKPTYTESISVFPNPANDWVNIGVSKTAKKRSVVVWDLQGTKMITFDMLPGIGTTGFPVQSFPQGMYIVELREQGLPIAVEKLIVSRN